MGQETHIQRQTHDPPLSHDSSFMAQRGMWHPMEQRIRDTGKGGMRNSVNVVRECKGHRGRGTVVRLESSREASPKNQPKGLEEAKRGIKKMRVGGSSRFFGEMGL